MLIISKYQIRSLLTRLENPEKSDECLQEVKAIKTIKEGLYWRADAGTCCGGPGLAGQLFGQLRILESVLLALAEADYDKARALLEEFASEVE